MKKTYRSKQQILHDILVVVRDSGTTNSHTLSRKSNLAHYPLVDKLDILRNSKMIIHISEADNFNFTLTTKGTKYIERFEQLVLMENELDV